MDGENHGKPLLKWMIWENPLFSETSKMNLQKKKSKVERLLPEVKSAALELQPVAVPCIGTAGG